MAALEQLSMGNQTLASSQVSQKSRGYSGMPFATGGCKPGQHV